MFIGSNRGFTLVQTMIGVAVLGVVVMGGASFMDYYNQTTLLISQRAAALELKTRLIQSMKDPNLCACTLNPALRSDTINMDDFVFNSTLPSGGTLSIQRVRVGCGASTALLAEGSLNVGAGLQIDQVTFTDLIPTGNTNEWRGKWKISFRQPAGRPALAPVEAHQFVVADPASITADPTRATIRACAGTVAATGLINVCPPGFFMVGSPNQYNTYCVLETVLPATNYMAAKVGCDLIRPAGFGPAHMCSRNEWIGGCTAPGSPASFGANPEWYPDNTDEEAGTLSRGSNCLSDGYTDMGNPNRVRCCLK